MVALLSAGLILFETSRIVNGGETNYVLATVGLYVSIFNLSRACSACSVSQLGRMTLARSSP